MDCPVCFKDEFAERRLIREVSVRRCLGCGLLFSRVERSRPFEAEFARVDAAAFRQAIGAVRERQAAEVLSLVGKHGAADGRWVDIGCGFGHLLREARRAGHEVFGVEPDETACTRARELIGGDSVHHGLMTEEVMPDGSAGVISVLDVLEHIPAESLNDFARTLRRKLRPGGLLVVKVPSTEGLYFIVAHGLARFARGLAAGVVKRLWQSEYEFPHTVYFSQHTLGRFLRNNGFDVAEARHVPDVPNETVIARLLMDDTIPPWQAYLMAPAFYVINFVEKWRGKSDALLMLARRPEGAAPPPHDQSNRL